MRCTQSSRGSPVEANGVGEQSGIGALRGPDSHGFSNAGSGSGLGMDALLVGVDEVSTPVSANVVADLSESEPQPSAKMNSTVRVRMPPF